MHAHKRTLYLVLLTLALLLIAAVPAWAAPALTVSPSTVNTSDTKTFTLELTGLNTPAAAINGQTITVTFPSGFSSTDDSVQITAVSGGQPYVFTATATPRTGSTYIVDIAVPSNAVPGAVTQLTISDLTMQTPASASSGQVAVALADGTNVSAGITVQQPPQAVTTVTISGPSTATAGQDFNVTGTITPALSGKTVTVNIKNSNGVVVASKTASTIVGNFEAGPFNLTAAGSYTIEATCDTVSATPASLTVNAAAAAKLVFTASPASLLKGQVGSFTVERRDQYDNPVSSGTTTVYLSAVKGTQAAGYFTSGGSTVSSVAISAGATATFDFTPTVDGTITITASAGGLTAATASLNVSAAPTTVTLSLTPALVSGGKPVAGTDITATLNTNVPADTNYTVKITLTPSAGTGWANAPATVTLRQGQSSATFTITTTQAAAGRELTVEVSFTPSGAAAAISASQKVGPFAAPTGLVPSNVTLTLTPAATDASGEAIPGTLITAMLTTDVPADKDYPITISLGGAAWASAPASVTLPKGQRSEAFVITTTSGAAGNTLNVTVSFTPTGASSPITAAGSVAFASSAPSGVYTRNFTFGWQVFSVPVKLDKSLVDLLGGADKFEALYLYDAASGAWKPYSQMTSEEQYGKPLVGYLVKMKQPASALANYLRVSGTQAVPPTLALKQGWNLVGASPVTGADGLSDMLSSVSGKFSTVINPGLGNSATWSAATSSSVTGKTVSVGDAYWVFMTADGTLAGLMAPPVQ